MGRGIVFTLLSLAILAGTFYGGSVFGESRVRNTDKIPFDRLDDYSKLRKIVLTILLGLIGIVVVIVAGMFLITGLSSIL